MFHWPLAAFVVLYLITIPVFALAGRLQRRRGKQSGTEGSSQLSVQLAVKGSGHA